MQPCWLKAPSTKCTMTNRARYDGSIEELLGVIKPFVRSACWFMYQEKHNEPIIPTTLVAHKGLVRALTSLQPNLSFSTKMLEQVFNMLVKELAFPELSGQDSQEEWVQTSLRRLHVACRHVSQSRLDRKSTRLNSSHSQQSRMPSSA